jgi:hypothetical protein
MPILRILWGCMRNQITRNCWIDHSVSRCAGGYAIFVEHPLCSSLRWISLLLKKIVFLCWLLACKWNASTSLEHAIHRLLHSNPQGHHHASIESLFLWTWQDRITFPPVSNLARGRPRLTPLHRLHVFVIIERFMNGSAPVSLRRMSSENRKLFARGQHSVQYFWTATGCVIKAAMGENETLCSSCWGSLFLSPLYHLFCVFWLFLILVILYFSFRCRTALFNFTSLSVERTVSYVTQIAGSV